MVIALELGRKTVSKIKQNLFWAFAYSTGLIPIPSGALVPLLGVGIFGWLPMLAAGAMAMSSVTVVGNYILLGRYKQPKLPPTTAELQRPYAQQPGHPKEVTNDIISKISLG